MNCFFFFYCCRGLFLIDDKGILRQITVNDLPVGRDVDETLRLIQAYQFTDKHGEVCPAGWKPGKDTVCRLFVASSSLNQTKISLETLRKYARKVC